MLRYAGVDNGGMRDRQHVTRCRQMPGPGIGNRRGEPSSHPLGEIGRQSAGPQQRRHADRGRSRRHILFGEDSRKIKGKFFRMLYHAHQCIR